MGAVPEVGERDGALQAQGGAVVGGWRPVVGGRQWVRRGGDRCGHLQLPPRVASSLPAGNNTLPLHPCCPLTLPAGDAVVIFNFRADRVIELSKALE